MNRRLFYFLLAGILLNSYSGNAQASNASRQPLNKAGRSGKVVALNLSGLLKGLADIEVSDLSDDTLCLISKDKFLQVDVRTGSVMLNDKISAFLSHQLKEKKYAKKLVVRQNHFYISFFNELYEVSKTGGARKIYRGGYAINDFSIGRSAILIASRDAIKMLDFNGRVLSSLFFDFTDAGYAKSAEGIYYSATPEDDIHSFHADNEVIGRKTFPPLSLNTYMKEPYLAYATTDNFIAFDYWDRSMLYILAKGDKKNALVKTIRLEDLSPAPSLAELKKEEGQPNFKIAYDGGIYYVIALSKGNLKIKPFTL